MWRKTRQCCYGWSSLIFSKTFSILRNILPWHSKRIVHLLFCVFQTKLNKAVSSQLCLVFAKRFQVMLIISNIKISPKYSFSHDQKITNLKIYLFCRGDFLCCFYADYKSNLQATCYYVSLIQHENFLSVSLQFLVD